MLELVIQDGLHIGIPSINNAHPHIDSNNKFAVVHNGIIENYLELKNMLIEKGCTFHSETDTEVIPNLLSYNYKKYETSDDSKDKISENIRKAVKDTMNMLQGSYALGILNIDNPECMYAARNKSPLLLGVKDDEKIIASDFCALSGLTNEVYLIENEEFAEISKENIKFFDNNLKQIEKNKNNIEILEEDMELGSYKHYMQKEIYENPIAVRNTLEKYFDENRNIKITLDEDLFNGVERITIIGCGTAMHAGLAMKYTLEELAGIPVTVEVASEFKYKRFILNEKDLVIFISQSGETADTISAQEIVKENGIKHISIVNVINSTLDRISDNVLYTKAGVEVAVASTKAYIAQVTLLNILAIYIAKQKNIIDENVENKLIDELCKIPTDIESILENEKIYEDYAKKIKDKQSMFFIGRGIDYYAVLEGSLKLKEISYVHSEAYQAGELKHGTIALIEKGTKVVAVCTDEKLLDKTISNVKEVVSRGAEVLFITNCENKVENIFENIIKLPKTSKYFSVILSVIPMQLIAYHTTVLKGLDVDKPRNLAKSVTVE
ncbi:MAG: glutamine--fructose-6-phosphate transaminase (isomerizing) [Clostridia bacterium]|nr:glutamine--fructose-6-phosphate transaminase (isomerizing) [Clostridia bacterium]